MIIDEHRAADHIASPRRASHGWSLGTRVGVCTQTREAMGDGLIDGRMGWGGERRRRGRMETVSRDGPPYAPTLPYIIHANAMHILKTCYAHLVGKVPMPCSSCRMCTSSCRNCPCPSFQNYPTIPHPLNKVHTHMHMLKKVHSYLVFMLC